MFSSLAYQYFFLQYPFTLQIRMRTELQAASVQQQPKDSKTSRAPSLKAQKMAKSDTHHLRTN